MPAVGTASVVDAAHRHIQPRVITNVAEEESNSIFIIKWKSLTHLVLL